MKIAVIDSGVDKNNKMLKNMNILGCSLRVTNECIERNNDFYDELGHGTAVFYLVNKFTDNDEIFNFKVFFDDMDLDMSDLNRILEYIYVNYSFDIINISFGSLYSNRLEELQNICTKLFYKGTFIVAAYDNYGAMSYPAACKYVLGVSAEDVIDNEIKLQEGVVNLVGTEKFYRVPWVNPEYNIVKGNSFLCAEATGFLCKNLKGDLAFRKKLDEIFNSYPSISSHEVSWIKRVKKAVVFPFNKEIHSIADNENMLDFEIVDYYHIRHSGIVNNKISKNFSYIKNDKIIKNIDNISYDDIDFLILGHCEEILKLTKIDYKNKIITECKKRNIKVYSFDKIDSDYKYIYTPTFINNFILHRYGKMYMIRQPIMSVIGTSSAQGKFTLQLYFRKKLLEAGYKVGQLGTEPEAKIFGMDITFPIGYNCMIRLSDIDMLLAVNQMLQEISSKDVDIIITGSQAGLIPVDWSNTKYITNRHQVYFQGISPDVIVLCINPYDNINFIKKTIHVAEGMSNGKVIGIVCYPLDVDSSWRGAYGSKIHISDIKITMLKKRIYEEFGINMYLLDRLEELDSLLQSIIDYLGK